MADITRWDPFSNLTDLHSQLDDMFKDIFSNNWAEARPMALPTMDIYSEDDKHLVAEFHAPGFNSDDIDIRVRNGVLEVKGEKKVSDEDKQKRSYMRRESFTSFFRSIALPKTADSEHVQAAFEDGVLTVTIPLKELPAPKKVAIESKKKK